MNKFLSILAFLICSNIITVFAQNTTLVVDNQNPGWLSSKIPFKDQESVKNLTVTGYLNGTDIKFIRELLNNRQLSHLDLSDANIVAGGDAYYDNKYYTADNQPMMTFQGIECDADIEIEDILYGGRYWYRTEKIDDHWYFYQAKVKFYNKSKLL